jgi:hypothetical protein
MFNRVLQLLLTEVVKMNNFSTRPLPVDKSLVVKNLYPDLYGKKNFLFLKKLAFAALFVANQPFKVCSSTCSC